LSVSIRSSAPTPDDDNPVKNRAVNAEDELFWRKVREAYRMVSADANKDIEFEVGQQHAHVNCRTDKTGKEFIAVHVWDCEPPKPVLVKP
jgi:hypothetical protein